MSILTYIEFVEVVNRFAFLQSKLQDEFLRQNSKAVDWKYLTDLPRRGYVDLLGERWSYRRHGLGVRFESERGLVIDVHKYILNKNVVDAHRICEYVISAKKDIEGGVDVYQDCVEALRNMELVGVVKKMDADGEAWLLV
ncbi:hypothetical protein K8353_34145 [Burkholderia contaminans]|nr:hypothetical protein [Burkholderia contaminans]